MSATPHDGWPQEGSVWEHWSDLLLATQLAALREGYTGVLKHWRADRLQLKLEIICNVNKNINRDVKCRQVILIAVAKVATDLAGKWVVAKLRRENLEVGRHTNHTGGIGVSKGFKHRPTKRPKLSIGRVVKDWTSMHALEGSLRSSARLEGRFISSYPGSTCHNSSNVASYSYHFSCVLSSRCHFYIRFEPYQQQDGAGWKCDKLCLQHSCSTIASPLSPNLQKVLDFWPGLKIQGGEYTEPTDREIRKDYEFSCSNTDQHLGDYPVLAPGQTSPRQVLPLPASAPVKPVDPKQAGSVVKAQIPPSKDRQILQTLKTRLLFAQTMDDTLEAQSLKKEIAELETGGSNEDETREVETKKVETESNKRQRTMDLLESLERKATIKKKSKSNLPSKPSSNVRLPPLPLNSNTPAPSTTTSATQFDELKQRQDSLVKAIDSLFSTRRLILDLEQKLAIASAIEDLDESKKLEGGMGELEKRKEEIEKKVTRRKNKVRRTKLRIKYEQMLDKTVTSKSDSHALKKQKKGKTAGKEKKSKGKRRKSLA